MLVKRPPIYRRRIEHTLRLGGTTKIVISFGTFGVFIPTFSRCYYDAITDLQVGRFSIKLDDCANSIGSNYSVVFDGLYDMMKM